ncbi:hypothetical protein An11g01370 [Aspergillus niger]|uniref:Uncharacterized protein n=2 Tax=Aspergillus niger TaxID=5061 RepID=A2QVH0_ASPNC|nr:hypothetical protein An11g01370 [Aspergillus niger]CAK45874.1 hypothetical protein An11g01370 [Aspergillus niger]
MVPRWSRGAGPVKDGWLMRRVPVQGGDALVEREEGEVSEVGDGDGDDDDGDDDDGGGGDGALENEIAILIDHTSVLSIAS